MFYIPLVGKVPYPPKDLKVLLLCHSGLGTASFPSLLSVGNSLFNRRLEVYLVS